MRSPYREAFLAAADAEIKSLTEHGAWEEDLKANATTKIVPSQWVFKNKRDPSGNIKKSKGRLVIRGDLQEHEGETFSPVAAWSTVRVFLVLSEALGRTTLTLDFSNAFIQSPLPPGTQLWMHVPRGYESSEGPDYCLRMLKSIYGTKDAPLLWFKYLTGIFSKLGLVQSTHDPCLWYGEDLMVVVYVDDIGVSATKKSTIDKFVQDLKNQGLSLTQESSFSEFLGIKFAKLPDGSIKMTQRGLIEKVLSTAGMSECNPNSTPATQAALGSDKEGEPMDETWDYRSIVGMLLYLSTNSRPDLCYAVSQVCRFTADPKKSHATAVKMILRYLKGTIDQGTIVKPLKQLLLHMHTDADFGGLFKREDDRDPNSVKARSCYLIRLSGWPILMKSFLQSHISQSTLEAEYSALSSALRVFLPLKRLIEEVVSKISGNTRTLEDSKIYAKVFEDNQGAYYLATNQRITNRTRYFLVKWHHFWESYNDGEFEIEKCPTDEMLADWGTKGLNKEKFEANRKKAIGW